MYPEYELQGFDHKSRLKRQAEAYEEIEREGNNGKHTGGNNTEECSSIMQL